MSLASRVTDLATRIAAEFNAVRSEMAGIGGGTRTSVVVDFGTTPRRALAADVAVPGVLAGQVVAASPSLDHPDGLSADEYELEPWTVAASAPAVGVVRLILAASGPMAGRRRANLTY